MASENSSGGGGGGSSTSTGTMSSLPVEEDRPNVPTDKLVLYVVKATATSIQNVLKPLILIEELDIEHHVQVISRPATLAWFHAVNPHAMVPAMEAVETRVGRRLNVWESTTCLTFLVDAFDSAGLFGGRDLWERTQVANWMALHTAALGAHAKFWLVLKAKPAEQIGSAMDILVAKIKEQYGILERRLGEPGHEYIALPDRPTIADIANLPFANKDIAASAGIDFGEWPRLNEWSRRMFARPAVQRAIARAQKFGHEAD